MLDFAHRTLTAFCPYAVRPPVLTPAYSFAVPDWPDWSATWLGTGSVPEATYDLLRRTDQPFLDPDLLRYMQGNAPLPETGLLELCNKRGERALATVQFLSFRADEQIQLDQYSTRGWRNYWAKWLRFEVLTVGQLLTTGPFAVACSATELPAELLARAAEGLAHRLRSDGRKLHAVLLKDNALLEAAAAHRWQALGYHQLPVQPNMELAIPPEWSRTEHYLEALSSKYRVRYRRARKKGRGLACRQLTPNDLRTFREKMYALYRAIATDAGFNAVELPPDYFLRLSEVFPKRLAVYGYFQQDKLVGFRTELASESRLFAHFIGFDPELNRSHQLYHNMLFDLLESAIYGGFRTLDYGRTALEIKSSVGADPVHYFCGLKSLIPGLNWLIPPVARYLSPVPEWQPRSPFK